MAKEAKTNAMRMLDRQKVRYETLQDAMKNSGSANSSATGLTAPDSSKQTTSIISDKIDLSTEDVAVFKAK